MFNIIKYCHEKFNKIKQIILAEKALKSVMVLLTGSGIAQLIPVLALPLIARLYTANDLGELALFVNIATFLVILATGKYEEAILLPKKGSVSINLVAGTIIISVVFAAALQVIVLGLRLFMPYQLTAYNLHNWILLIPLSVLFLATFNIFTSFANRYSLYNHMSISKLWRSIITAVFKLTAGILKMGAWGLIIGTLLGNIMSALYITRVSLKYKKHQLDFLSRQKVLQSLKNYAQFPKFSMIRALANTLSGSLPVYFLFIFFGTEVTGQYAMAATLSFIPIHLLAQSLYQVYFQKVSEKHNKGKAIAQDVAKIAKWIAALITVPFLLIAVFTTQITDFILGEAWIEAGVILRYLMPWLFMVAVVTPLGFIPKLANRLKAEMLIDMAYLVLRVLALYTGVVLNNHYYSIILFSLTGVLVLGFFIYWFLDLSRQLDNKLAL
jgi:O-antigen/teichoic acid export membrane protein